VWIVGNAKQTMSFRNDTQYPILISGPITGRRQQAVAHVQDLERAERPEATVTNTVIQPGERAVDTDREGSDQAGGYRFRNNAAVDGAKVWTTVSIYDHGKLHWRSATSRTTRPSTASPWWGTRT
jgi:hypothetical protein